MTEKDTQEKAPRKKSGELKGRPYRDNLIADMRKKGYLAPPYAAVVVKVSASTMYRWADENIVESVTIGNAKFVSVESLKKKFGDEAWSLMGCDEKLAADAADDSTDD